VIHWPNYFLAREFIAYLSEVMQLNPTSVYRYWPYLKHLLIWADAVPFSQAAAIRPTFTSYLAALGQSRSEPAGLAGMTLKKILQTAKRFFGWLKTMYPQQYRQLPPAWIDALRLPRGSRPVEEHKFVRLEQVLELIGIPIPDEDIATWRDQAAAAMLFLSGARATAFTTLTLECVDLPNRTVKQWTELGVKTKNSKSATTFLLEVPELLHFVERWDGYVRSRLPSAATWYTPILQNWGDQTLSAVRPGSNRNVALGRRMCKLFALAQIPCQSPHAFRHGHAVFALQHCRTMADYKAVSMNLMHDSIAITDGIYAPLATEEVRYRVATLTGLSSAQRTLLPDDPAFVQGMTDDQLAAALTVAAKRLAK
jgi:integrase